MKKICSIILVLISLTVFKTYANTAEELFDQGNEFMTSGDIATALTYYKAAYKKEPANETMLEAILKTEALILYNARQYQQAADKFYRASQINEPTDIDKHNASFVYFGWAVELYESGKMKEALKKAEKAIEYNDQDVTIYNFAGTVAYYQNQFDKAVYFWEQAMLLSEDKKALQKKIKKTKKEAAIEKDFIERYFNPFIIYFPGTKDPGYVSKVLMYLSRAKQQIQYDTRLDLRKNTPVIIYIGEQFKQATESTGRVKGLYDGKIRISEQDISKGDISLKNVIFHEYAHAVLVNATEAKIPIWFNEGFAQYCEPDRHINEEKRRFVQNVVHQNPNIDLARVNLFFQARNDPDTMSFAYVFSHMLVEYMINKYGKHRFVMFLNALKKNKDFEVTFKKTFLVSSDTVEKEFFKTLL